MGLYTVKQVADELEVTTQAIYKRVNDTKTNKELINFITTDEKGVKCFDEVGLDYLRQLFNKKSDPKPTEKTNDELIEMLKAEIKRRDQEIERLHDELKSVRADFKEQLSVKDEQLERTQRQNENAQSIIYSMQQAQSKRKLLDFFRKKPSEQ